ncbi:hypothetical protein [Pseudarthrobacter sp. LT1]|uniref:hypothetical protein n=1 Tax=Pseudarthrobacter sp. LT1 TaxID=3111450 RepID=UPI002D789935|nr:hypothetical protein [Pseudarthrobacter sp. LT1]WRT15618.1 hypothetical protein VIK36_09145 [Pseudarthrobacter sp. LT1]
MQASPRDPQARKPAASTEEARRRLTRIAYWSLPFMIIFGVWNFIPNISLPWLIAKVAVQTIFVIVLGAAAIRFSLWQRDEYWRERGRDPKHPERFPKDRRGDDLK